MGALVCRASAEGGLQFAGRPIGRGRGELLKREGRPKGQAVCWGCFLCGVWAALAASGSGLRAERESGPRVALVGRLFVSRVASREPSLAAQCNGEAAKGECAPPARRRRT